MNPPLRVALLHNYRDEQQPSMRLYAERLGDALRRRRVQVTRDPTARRRARQLAPAIARSGRSSTAMSGRFAVYPRLVRNSTRTSFTSSTTGKGIWSAISIAAAPSSPVTTSSCSRSRRGASAARPSPPSRCSCSGSRSSTSRAPPRWSRTRRRPSAIWSASSASTRRRSSSSTPGSIRRSRRDPRRAAAPFGSGAASATAS